MGVGKCASIACTTCFSASANSFSSRSTVALSVRVARSSSAFLAINVRWAAVFNLYSGHRTLHNFGQHSYQRE